MFLQDLYAGFQPPPTAGPHPNWNDLRVPVKDIAVRYVPQVANETDVQMLDQTLPEAKPWTLQRGTKRSPSWSWRDPDAADEPSVTLGGHWDHDNATLYSRARYFVAKLWCGATQSWYPMTYRPQGGAKLTLTRLL